MQIGRSVCRRRRHLDVKIRDVHKEALGKLVPAIGRDDLEATTQGCSAGNRESHLGFRLTKLEGPAPSRDAAVAMPLHSSFASRDLDLQGYIRLAADFGLAHGEKIKAMLSVAASDRHPAWPTDRDDRLLVVPVSTTLEPAVAQPITGIHDQRAPGPGAAWGMEVASREAADERPADTGAVGPINVVARGLRLVRRSRYRQRAAHKARPQVHVALPVGGLRQPQRQAEIVDGEVWCDATELRRHLTRAVARDRHQRGHVARHCKGAVQLQLQHRLARRGYSAQRMQLEASLGDKVEPVVLHIGLVSRRSDGHGASNDSNPRVGVRKGQVPRRVDWRPWRLEGCSGLQCSLGIDAAAGQNLAAKLRILPDAGQEHLPYLLHAKARAVHPDQRCEAGDVGRCHGGAAEELVALARNGRVDAAARRGHVHRLRAIAREGGERPVPGRGGDGDDIGHWVA
mmetsp:Transcript_29422/g.84526  ORF Transcript_29422/g.84526 Transcript_29422/m.84526 type:complete len:456 (+) Transcript_29422:1990-3357(+)